VHCTDPRAATAPQAPRRAPFSVRARRAAAWLALGALAACHTMSTQTMADYKLRAAKRIVAANPGITYTTPSPDPLLAIPVLEIEVNADGSVRHITVLRVPTQAQDTLQIAVEAVRRAAPFGDASRLPKPWKFSEAFLFDDERHFKPRTLD
jgi:hypothetical protein